MTQSFGVRHNRPAARTVSPAKLIALGCALIAVTVLAFTLPSMLREHQNSTATDHPPDRQASLGHRKFGFEDAPRTYGELGRIEPVNVFRELPEVKDEPQIIIKEVIREVPVSTVKTPSKAEQQDEAARSSPLTFTNLANRPPDGTRVVLGPRTLPLGHRLAVRLDHAINSETPGLVTATVVHDSYGLVPSGAKLIGRYDGTSIRFSGSRLPVIFSELQTQGRVLAIQAHASDEGGRAGLEGEVDRHVGALIGLSALNAVSGAAIGSTARRGDDFEAALAGESIREGARLSRDIGRQVLDVAPTIDIPAGTEFWVVLLEALRL